MKAFWMTLVGVSLLSGALFVLCPKGHKKYLRLLTGLCLLSVMAGPLLSLADDGLSGLAEGLVPEEDALSNYDEIYNQTLLQADAAYLEELIEKQIEKSFSMDRESFFVTVSLVIEENKAVMKKTTVVLHGSAVAADPYPIIEKVEQMTEAPCVIVYD